MIPSGIFVGQNTQPILNQKNQIQDFLTESKVDATLEII